MLVPNLAQQVERTLIYIDQRFPFALQKQKSSEELTAAIPDPVMDSNQAMANATLYAMRTEIDDSLMRFLQTGDKTTGIWIAEFPKDTTKRALLLMFCEWHKNEKAKAMILNNMYRIVQNREKGGYDVMFE